MTNAAEPARRRSFQTSDGVHLSFLEGGRQNVGMQKPTIVLVPGWLMPATIWQGQLEGLSQHYHVVALDPRGQGQSAVPPWGYTAERRAADLHEFVKPFSSILLIGWSLGAIEALQYVHLYGDERIAGLVLVDSSVGEEPAPASSEIFLRRLRADRGRSLDEFVRALFRVPQPQTELDRLVQWAQQMDLDDSLALLSYPFVRTHWKRIAHGFKKPLLYVVTPEFEAQAQNLQINRPGTQSVVFRNAGHALFVDETERFNRLIAKFAGSLAPQPSAQSAEIQTQSEKNRSH